MKNVYYIEVTDINYIWVHRFEVTASTERGAMRKIASRLNCRCGVRKDYEKGDTQRWVWRNGNLCAYVERYDNQNAKMQRAEIL